MLGIPGGIPGAVVVAAAVASVAELKLGAFPEDGADPYKGAPGPFGGGGCCKPRPD